MVSGKVTVAVGVDVVDVRRERNEIWFPLLEAAEIVAESDYCRLQQSFDDLRNAIHNARSRGYVR